MTRILIMAGLAGAVENPYDKADAFGALAFLALILLPLLAFLFLFLAGAVGWAIEETGSIVRGAGRGRRGRR